MVQRLIISRDETRKKKIGGPNLGQIGQYRAQNYIFCHIIKSGLLIFREIASDDSLEHCLTSSRGKTHGKKLGAPNWI